MENMSCVVGHNYGLWREENGMACRTCQECLYIESLPIDDEKRMEIKKQNEARAFLKALKKVELSDSNIVGYLCAILQDYYNYLDKDGKEFLFNKVDKIREYKSNKQENIDFVNHIYSSLENETLENFDNIFEHFKVSNDILFENDLMVAEANSYHR